MSEQWWYRILGQEFGPVDLAMIQQLLQDKTLGSTDQIRQGVNGAWKSARNVSSSIKGSVPPGKVSDTLPSPNMGRSPVSKSSKREIQEIRANEKPVGRAMAGSPQQAEHVPKNQDTHTDAAAGHMKPERRSELSTAILQATRDSLHKQRSQSKRHTRRGHADASGSIRRAAKSGFGGFVNALTLLMYPLFLLGEFTHKHWKIVVVVLLGGLTIAAVVFLPPYLWTDVEIHQELQAMKEEIEQVRTSSADDPQWDEMTHRLLGQCRTIVSKLESTADAKRPARLELFMIARDYLPAILQSGRDGTDRSSEENFNTHMQIVTYLLQSKGAPQNDSNWVMLAILTGDGVLLAVGGIWFFRRRT